MSSHIQHSSSENLPQSLDRQLRGFRRRLRILKLVEVLLAATAGLVFAYLIVFAIERFMVMPSSLRAITLVLGTIGFSIVLPLAIRKWFWNTRRLEQVARFLRTAFPVLGDEILSVIEMTDSRRGQGASPRLIAAATEQTRLRVEKHDLAAAAPARNAKKRTMIVLAVVGLAILLMIAVPTAAGNSWQRFLNPWTETPRFTFANLAELPEKLIVPYGESFQFDVPLEKKSEWKPETATARIGSTNISASCENGAYRFSMPAQTNESRLDLVVGDDRQSLTVLPMTRPKLTSVTAKITLPDYLKYPNPIERTSSSRRFNTIAGSQIELSFQANRDIESATLDTQSINIDGQHLFTDPILIEESRQCLVNWCDTNNLQPRKPIPLIINVVEDQSPTIVFEQLKNRVLLESKSIRFNFNGRDDFGIKKIGLEWIGQSTSDVSTTVKGEKILFAGSPQNTSVDEQGIFTPRLENVVSQVLTLRLFIEDYQEQSRIYSPSQTLHVMSHDEHVAWINENMQRWKLKADAIYEREVGLAEENRELRRLDDKDRHLPENIRRMENQVAAERDNAQRLDQAVEQGRDLIEQALMNENLRAEQVSQWANSLAQLQELAQNDMPSIANLLNKIKQNLQTAPPSSSEDESDDQKPKGAADQKIKNPDEQKPKDAGQESDSKGPDQKIDIEDSMAERKEDGSEAKEPGSSKSKLDLPSTNLLNPETEKEQEEGNGQQEKQPPAEPTLDDVIEDQEKLLEEFQKARKAMDEIATEFESSTFVKRFKAAARLQLKVASQLNQLIPHMFGEVQLDTENILQESASLTNRQRDIFENMQRLKVDLEAYQSREPNDSQQAILDEMNSSKMLLKLEELPKRLEKNRLGDSLHRSEFWADTFDRWAEELVPPSRPGGGGDAKEEKSLPPAVILEVMRQIEDEMNLRDETRSFELARSAIPTEERQERNDGLTVYQMSVQERSLDTIDDIKQLPEGEENFNEQIGKLKKAVTAMNEATGMLFDGTTDNPALAAETAAIEALLESRRTDPPSASKPQDNESGQDGSESLAGSSSMNMLNPGQMNSSRAQPRDVGAGTSASLDNVPERFRNGIDDFTNQLGRLRRNKNQ